MALITYKSHTKIVRFNPHSLPVAELITMSGNDITIVRFTAAKAIRTMFCGIKDFGVSIWGVGGSNVGTSSSKRYPHAVVLNLLGVGVVWLSR